MNEFYQEMKPIIVRTLDLSKDAIHIHVGFLAFALGWILVKKYRYSWKSLLFPFTLSLVMEVLDAVTDQQRIGRFLYTSYLHDLINTNLIPVLCYLILRWSKKRKEFPV